MAVILSDEELKRLGLSEADVRLEVAVALFARERLTLAAASQFAGLHPMQFQRVLGERHIPVHYDVNEFEQDVKNLRQVGLL